MPRDAIAPRVRKAVEASRRRAGLSLGWTKGFSFQFWVAVGLYFGLFALNQLVRVATPIAFEDMVGSDRAAAVAGIVFSAGGAASVIGVTVVARWMGSRMSLRRSLIMFTIASALSMPLLAVGTSPWLFGAGFLVFALVNAASMPATNTLIAETVDTARRGTAFGLASSAQALAFMVGPMAAAFFATFSLGTGFLVCGLLFLGLSLMVTAGIREGARALSLAEAV